MTVNSPTSIISEIWRDAFMSAVAAPQKSEQLREASLHEDLRTWTALLTKTVIASCLELGLSAAAKGSKANFFPQTGQEFLGLDVVAVQSYSESHSPTWRLPVAVFELENSSNDNRVGYSLWKVMCVRSQLRVVFAYRRSWDLCSKLVQHLTDTVAKQLFGPEFAGECILAIGSRGEGEGFPWGYFKFYQLNKNLLRFEKF